jgi:hypothetical protein
MVMKYFSPLVVTLLFSFTCFSQKKWPGYVVMNNGDTVRGMLKRTSKLNNKPAFILYDSNDKKQKILETEALAFGWVNDTLRDDYAKIKVRNSPEPYSFLRLISKGRYSVFEDRTFMGTFTMVEYFFKSPDGKVIVLNFSDKFDKKNTLRQIFADCPALIEQIKGYVTQQKVLNWIEEYNNCMPITTN